MAFTPERMEELLHVIQVETVGPVPASYPPEVLALQGLANRETVELEAGGMPFRIYLVSSPEMAPGAPLYVRIHGGGWYRGYEINDGCFSSWLAREIGGVVLDVDYSPSPLAPITVMAQQCRAALEYARENAVRLGCSPDRISMGGCSAGGQLTASILVEKIMEGSSWLPALQILAYAPLDLRAKPSIPGSPAEENGKKRGYAFNALACRDDFSLFESPVMSPYCANDLVLSQMPQTLVVTAGRCGFRFEDEAFASRLAALGVETTICRFPSAAHGFVPHFGPDWKKAGLMMAKYIVAAGR